MVLAYILISSAPRASYDIRNELLKLEEVKEANVVFGQYDIVAKVEVPDSESLGTLVFNKIRAIDTVIATATLTVIPK